MKEEIIEKLKSDYPALENLSEEEVLAKYFEILGHPVPKPTAKKYKTYTACLEKLINEGKICIECYYELAKGVCETCRNRKRNTVSDEIKQLRKQNVPLANIANQYSISFQTVSSIAKGTSWKRLENCARASRAATIVPSRPWPSRTAGPSGSSPPAN
jgi:hypothetical protein